MYTILIVDDNKTNLQIVRHILGEGYNLLPAISGEMAVRYAEKKDIDLILMDMRMQGMDGLQTMQAIRQIPGRDHIPVIFVTGDSRQDTETECLRQGACDFISKPFVPEVLRTRIARVLELESYRRDMQGRLRAQTAAMENVILQTITTIANTLDAKDEYTKGHSVRVADYAAAIAELRNWPKEERDNLHQVALLHDVGKIGVPDAVLKKEGQLSDKEFRVIKTHTEIGASILKDIKSLRHVSIGARFHHERFDGQGYPQGLKGEEIPEIARIIAIADAYDAMTSDRCYRPNLGRNEAKARLMQGAGTQFDPELVALFMKVLDAEKCALENNN